MVPAALIGRGEDRRTGRAGEGLGLIDQHGGHELFLGRSLAHLVGVEADGRRPCGWRVIGSWHYREDRLGRWFSTYGRRLCRRIGARFLAVHRISPDLFELDAEAGSPLGGHALTHSVLRAGQAGQEPAASAPGADCAITALVKPGQKSGDGVGRCTSGSDGHGSVPVVLAHLEFDQVAQVIGESGQVPAARVGG